MLKEQEHGDGEVIQTLAFLPNPEIYKKGIKRFCPFDKLEDKDVSSFISKTSIEYYEVYQVKLKFHNNSFKYF